MKTALLAAVLLVSGCATHVSYSPEIDADGGGDVDPDAGAEDLGDAEASSDGAVDGEPVDPLPECEPGDTRTCRPPGCDASDECGGAQRCVDDGRWGGCGQCPPGVENPEPEMLGDGIDNDCDGEVDECDGTSSECDCDAECVPGSTRRCEDPTYGAWGSQVCRDDATWGSCAATIVPASCNSFGWLSPAAEMCMIEAGECIQDLWDLDYDGDAWESLPPTCEPGLLCM